MTNPRISIVTPSYNQGPFIEHTIRSVVDQDYANLEYVIIDGGSQDGSLDIIKRYSDRLAYWVSEPDGGHADALNKGFRQTSGEIMAWLNSDDMYMPWTFDVVAEIFETFPEVNWIVGLPGWWDPKGRLVRVDSIRKNIYDFLLGNFTWIQQESVFWRRSLWERAGGYVDENYQFMVDGELWCRFFLLDRLYHVDSALGGFRHHGANRAKLHYGQVLAEMRQAIQQMRQKCPASVLQRYSTLRTMQRLQKAVRLLPMDLALRNVRSRLFEDVAYDVIAYFPDGWRVGKERFRLD